MKLYSMNVRRIEERLEAVTKEVYTRRKDC
jgi:hypothetical protein